MGIRGRENVGEIKSGSFSSQKMSETTSNLSLNANKDEKTVAVARES